MCGIVGIWERDGKVDAGVLESMRDSLTHRGPDDSGVFIDAGGQVGLGHRRLSILDPSPSGHQPMERAGAWAVHNGEVYNFAELRRELEALGHRFSTGTDTEVVLLAYRQWGLEAVHRFRGMFATAIWDENARELHLIRDRVGVKPLYYAVDEHRVVFASELRALLRHPAVEREEDLDALHLYFKLSFIPSPYSIIRGVSKLEPGHTLTIGAAGPPRIRRYWSVFDAYRQPLLAGVTEDEASAELERLLVECFQLRMVSDVPVGLFLSGGIDSTTVAALLQSRSSEPLRTFTVAFSASAWDESKAARRIADHLGTDHHEFRVDPSVALETIPRLGDIYDEPFGDSSGVPTNVISRFAAQHVKVALSADGGDELFLGYRHHRSLMSMYPRMRATRPLWNVLASAAPGAAVSRLHPALGLKLNKMRQLSRHGASMARFLFTARGEWCDDEIDRLLGRSGDAVDRFVAPFEEFEADARDFGDFMRAADYRSLMSDDMLVKVDRASMAESLEVREPLLDHRIVEYVARLPRDLVFRDGVSKHLMRRVLYRFVPRELVDRPKQGFAVPVDEWLRRDLRPLLTDYINRDRIVRGGVLAWKDVEAELNAFLSGRRRKASRVWLLLEYLLWRERWIESPA